MPREKRNAREHRGGFDNDAPVACRRKEKRDLGDDDLLNV
jgi:hypothetical protein